METKNYINMLKDKRRAPIYVAMRQSLCYYLFSNNIPYSIIMNVMKIPKSSVYFSISQAKGMLEIGDKIMTDAYDEIKQHKIRIVPCTADGEILSKCIGYTLLIDNINY